MQLWKFKGFPLTAGFRVLRLQSGMQRRRKKMIQTNMTERRSPHFRMLSDDQIAELIRGVFEVMEKVGFKVLHEGARMMLEKALRTFCVDGDGCPEEYEWRDEFKLTMTYPMEDGTPPTCP